MLIRYIGKKTVKRDTVNDPQTAYVWEATNGFIVDVKPEHVPRLLRHDDVWEKVEELLVEEPTPKEPVLKEPVPKVPAPKGVTSA